MAKLVSDAQLAYTREVRRKSLFDSCDIYDVVAGPVGEKGTGQTWPAVSRAADCNIIRRQVAGAGNMDNLMVEFHWEAILPHGTTIAVPAHIKPTSGAHAGKTFEVYDLVPSGTYDNTVRVSVSEIAS